VHPHLLRAALVKQKAAKLKEIRTAARARHVTRREAEQDALAEGGPEAAEEGEYAHAATLDRARSFALGIRRSARDATHSSGSRAAGGVAPAVVSWVRSAALRCRRIASGRDAVCNRGCVLRTVQRHDVQSVSVFGTLLAFFLLTIAATTWVPAPGRAGLYITAVALVGATLVELLVRIAAAGALSYFMERGSPVNWNSADSLAVAASCAGVATAWALGGSPPQQSVGAPLASVVAAGAPFYVTAAALLRIARIIAIYDAAAEAGDLPVSPLWPPGKPATTIERQASRIAAEPHALTSMPQHPAEAIRQATSMYLWPVQEEEAAGREGEEEREALVEEEELESEASSDEGGEGEGAGATAEDRRTPTSQVRRR